MNSFDKILGAVLLSMGAYTSQTHEGNHISLRIARGILLGKPKVTEYDSDNGDSWVTWKYIDLDKRMKTESFLELNQ